MGVTFCIWVFLEHGFKKYFLWGLILARDMTWNHLEVEKCIGHHFLGREMNNGAKFWQNKKLWGSVWERKGLGNQYEIRFV